MLLGRAGSGADKLDRCLSQGETPSDPETRAMVAIAAALTPREPTSETGRMRAFDAVMRKAARRANPVEHDGAGEDLAEPVIHSRTVQAGPGLTLRVSDIDPVDDDRLMEIAARAAARLSERSRDRNA